MNDSSTRRRRRAPAPSPTSMIVNFFLDAPIEQAMAAFELASTLMARRQTPKRTFEQLDASIREKAATLNKPAVTPPTPPALAAEAAPAPAPAPAIPRSPRAPRANATAPPRQRAKRSDAGVPRAGRPRPPVDVPLPGTTARAQPLPELPPQDVPYEARDVDPVEV